jgi:hypothetical protein
MKEMLEKQAVLKAVADEPEYPGTPPKLMEIIRKVIELKPPRQGLLLIARLAVKQTKQCIAERVNKLPTCKGTNED